MNATDLGPAALLEAMHAVLDEDPSDVVTRLAVADLLEDAGDGVAARGQRWQALHRKWAARHRGGWRWWPRPARMTRPEDTDDLSHEVFRHLPAAPGGATLDCRYPTRRAAEADLALALEALAAREAVLAGYEAEPCPWCGARKMIRSRSFGHCDGCDRGWTR